MKNPEKKILFLLPRPNLGGASQVLLNLLVASRDERSFQPFFLFEESGTSLPEYQEHGPSYVFPLERFPLIRKIGRKVSLRLYDYARYWYARWVFTTHNFERIYINSLTQNSSLKAALNSSIPLILHAHEMDFLVTFKLPDVWVRNILTRADQVIVCSNAVGRFYERTYGLDARKVKVIHGPVSSQRLLNNSPTSSPQPASQDIVLGVVANFSYLKGPDILVEALRIVNSVESNAGRKVVCRWLGAPVLPTPYFESIQHLVGQLGLEGCITFLPASPQSAVFYPAIDIFVLPSRIEAFPLTILEAMLFAKPVVAMDVGGIGEAVDAETGYLVKDRTPEGLAEGIRYFMQSEARRTTAGQNGRKRVLENFEAQVQVKKWLYILENT